jgi:hypothetical protein
VLLPLLPNVIDFGHRAAELLTELARLERRSPETLALEMVSEGSDVCEWRATHPTLIDNSIPLADGELLVASAQECNRSCGLRYAAPPGLLWSRRY